MKYKQVIHKWQKKEFGKLSSIIPVLFYQGLDNWEPESEFEEIRKLSNPILSGTKEEFLIFDLQKIEPIKDFVTPELRAGLWFELYVDFLSSFFSNIGFIERKFLI